MKKGSVDIHVIHNLFFEGVNLIHKQTSEIFSEQNITECVIRLMQHVQYKQIRTIQWGKVAGFGTLY